jgi:hypothetical protein
VHQAESERGGSFSFAFTDELGRTHGYQMNVPRPSASAIKAFLLLAYLRLPEVRSRELVSGEREHLEGMITVSANQPAADIYAIVGEERLARLARELGLTSYVGGGAGGWGLIALSARDWTRFYMRLPRWLPDRHQAFTMTALNSIHPSQGWGIPITSRWLMGWTTFFKGGWIPTASGWIMTQNARLDDDGGTMAISILSEGRPSFDVGVWDIQLLAWNILKEHPRYPAAASERRPPAQVTAGLSE